MYFFKKKPNGQGIQLNEFGMKLVETIRGTNRTEAIHGNLHVTFGGWKTGAKMSHCLLGEFRHRANEAAARIRRPDYPFLNHFDTWLVDELQNLYLDNRNMRLYPNWSNASDYAPTDEGFDTIALHCEDLHDALIQRCQNLDFNDVKLTIDQQFIADALGVPLPFLPFTTMEEKEQYANCLLDPNFPKDDTEAAIKWCEYVDGVKIMPKLPVHFRNYGDKFERNGRVKQAEENTRSGNDMLKQLNAALASQSEAAARVHEALPIAPPNPQAMRADAYVTVGDVGIGNVPESERVATSGGWRKGCKDTKKRAPRTCNNCKEGYERLKTVCPAQAQSCERLKTVCPGRTARGTCTFFVGRVPIPCPVCERFEGPNKDTCRDYDTTTKKRICQFFHDDGVAKT